jgi:hypothetical protein
MLWKLLAWVIPGAQPIALVDTILSFLGAAAKGIAAFIKAFFKSAAEVLQHPGTWIAIGVAVLIALAGGIKLGKEWDEHLVERADGQRLTAIKLLDERTQERDALQKERNQWEGRLNEQEKRASEAEKAGKLAEDKVRAAIAARDRAQRLLQPPSGNTKAGPAPAAGPGLPSLQKLFGGG